MNDLLDHYTNLLGLNETSWSVSSVDLVRGQQKVVVGLVHQKGVPVKCSSCGESGGVFDHAPKRSWRHLDTMKFETEIQAKIPRCRCDECGVKTIQIPWADRFVRLTREFECHTVRVLQECGNVKRATNLLGIDWSATHAIMKKAVERGLERRGDEEIPYVGMDEKSFGRGQDYVSLMTDLVEGRVLEVVPERTKEAADKLWECLSTEQREGVMGVAMDMWQAYIKSAGEAVPEAAIVHDKFHIAKYLTEAVDKVRRGEHRELKKSGDETLTGSRQLWLFNHENVRAEKWKRFEELSRADLKTARAWAIKENFRWFWEYTYPGNARKFFKKWYGWATRSQLEPIRKVARMLKGHFERIVSYFEHPITNAVTEGLNSRIQELKSSARGFRGFSNYRARILFYCGKLELMPNGANH